MGIGAAVGRIFRRGRGGFVLAALFLVMLLGAGRAHGQAVKGQIVTVGLGGLNGQNGVYREGSWIPVQVRIRNLTGQPFVGHLAVDQDQVDLDGDKVLAIGPEFTLAPGVEERTLWTYYWPRPDFSNFDRGISKVVVLDKNGAVVADSTLTTSTGIAQAVDIGPVDAFANRRSARFVVVLGRNFGGWRSFDGMYGGTEAVRSVQLSSASQLPDRVLGYDGVDVIYWQADAVKLADLAPPEFTLAPILAWVRAGGHLVISVGSPEQQQAFARAEEAFRTALPMQLTGTRDVRLSEVGALGKIGSYGWGNNLNDEPGKPSLSLIQATGTLKPGARAVIGDAPGAGATFSEHPLVVTGSYGEGAITLVTVDMSDPEILQRLSDKNWIHFWNSTMGWRQNDFFSNVISAVDFNKLSNQAKDDSVSLNPQIIRLEDDLEKKVDVTDVTAVRILVALVFLALYWLLAGPVGHLILRVYKVSHWSWWVFGGMVILATAVAGVVVLVLHVSNYEVRHYSFVVGTVKAPENRANSDASVFSMYGIYAPVSGLVPIKQPETTGLHYLTPLCLPSTNDVKSFADPQSYVLRPAQPGEVSPVFRNTLKKLQGRWQGPLAGIEGVGEYVSNSTDLNHLVSGIISNRSGYDLHDPDILVYAPRVARAPDFEGMNTGSIYLYHIKSASRIWKNGDTVDLKADLQFDGLGMGTDAKAVPGRVETALEVIGWKYAPGQTYYNPYNSKPKLPNDPPFPALRNMTWRSDLLYLLADARNNDPLNAEGRCELSRGIGRLTDCTKLLHASGALIVAHAEGVRSPVTLNVNGKAIEGKGDVVFAWALPLAGAAPQGKLGLPSTAPAGGAGGQQLIPDNKPEGP